ncbi:MAG: hypothetical protein OJI67_09595, partial [Prosthecobacter sp.]|nr:hypothetical protein [Prosthecobacter sp.]
DQSFGPGNYPPSWKLQRERGGWAPTDGTSWNQALEDLRSFKGSNFDCSRPPQYGRMWGELQGGNSNVGLSVSPTSISYTKDVNDWIPGDQGIVKNNNTHARQSNWHQENVVYLGAGKGFYANGMNPNPTTMPDVIRHTTSHGYTGTAGTYTPATIEPMRYHVGVGLQQ